MSRVGVGVRVRVRVGVWWMWVLPGLLRGPGTAMADISWRV